mmetsp:Transcript_102476/g.198406  ORF Transcript_102476/g.198406 Transcript_102476/m.198406 type:complete len:273 (+) Transcript_102476:190-1008(+)
MKQLDCKINKIAFGPEYEEVAKKCSAMGFVLQERGNLDSSEKMFRHALLICERTLGLEHRCVAYSCDNLGSVLLDTGDLDGAEAMHRRSLKIKEKEHGLEHLDVASSCQHLSNILMAKHDLDGAEMMQLRALMTMQKVLGPLHPQIAISCGKLGGILQDKGKFHRAKRFFQCSIRINEKILGPTHPETIKAQQKLQQMSEATNQETAIRLIIEQLDTDRTGRISMTKFTDIIKTMDPSLDSSMIGSLTGISTDGTANITDLVYCIFDPLIEQ